MFRARDFIESSPMMKKIWNIGLHAEAASKEDIYSSNIVEIVNEINKNDSITPHLSGILLHGIAILYSKKTIYILDDCNKIIARISLHQKPQFPEKSKRTESSQIDEQILSKWRGTNQIQDLLLSSDDEHEIVHVDLNIPKKAPHSPILLPPNIASEEDDLGESFHPDENFTQQFEKREGIHYSDEENQSTCPEKTQCSYENKKQNNIRNVKENSFKKIDPSPIMSLVEVSQMLENSSSLLVDRPQRMTINTNDRNFCSNEVKDIFDQAKAITTSSIIEIIKRQCEDITDSDPIPCFGEIPDHNEEKNEEKPDNFDSEDDLMANRLMMNAFLKKVKRLLNGKAEVEFNETVSRESRKDFTMSFYHALCLASDDIINLTQDEETFSIFISRGENYSQ